MQDLAVNLDIPALDGGMQESGLRRHIPVGLRCNIPGMYT